jgi:hypothetical protein
MATIITSSDASAALASSWRMRDKLAQRSLRYLACLGYDTERAMHWHRLSAEINETLRKGKAILATDPAKMVAIRKALEAIDQMMVETMKGKIKHLGDITLAGMVKS